MGQSTSTQLKLALRGGTILDKILEGGVEQCSRLKLSSPLVEVAILKIIIVEEEEPCIYPSQMVM